MSAVICLYPLACAGATMQAHRNPVQDTPEKAVMLLAEDIVSLKYTREQFPVGQRICETMCPLMPHL